MLLRKAMKSVSVRKALINDNVNRLVKWNILVNKDLMSKVAIITLLVLKDKCSISLTKENVSVIIKGLVEKG